MNAMPGSPHRIDLSTTLNRVGLAMRDLGQMITAIEASILDSVQVNTSEMPVPPRVQQLDLALQTIEELALLMQRLSDHPLPEVRCSPDDMITPIRLERLRRLIASGRIQEDAPLHAVGAGHVSLF